MENKERERTPDTMVPRAGMDADRLSAFNKYRGLLFSIAYRMLGSVADAGDMLQETFLRWQQAANEGIGSARAYLVTIVTRLCINQLQSARARREEYVGEWLPEPLVSDPQSDPLGLVKVDESLSMAFLFLLERLTPTERAVFLLREVFEYEYSEISSALGVTETNCRQILSRARQHVGDVRRRFDASAREHSELLGRFVRAARSGDLEGLVSMLAGDAVLHTDGGGKAAALPKEVHGAESIARAILKSMGSNVPREAVSRLARINGEPGFVGYVNGKPFSAFTIDVREGRVQGIYIVTNPEKLSRIPDLPETPV